MRKGLRILNRSQNPPQEPKDPAEVHGTHQTTPALRWIADFRFIADHLQSLKPT